MRIVYNLGILLFGLIASVLALKKPKAKLWKQGRKNLIKRIKATIPSNEKTIWVHCASLGEFEQGRPLIEAIREEYPEKKILLTFFSPSGYEVQKNYEHADYIFYLPLDTPLRAKRFVKAVNPEVAFFIKYEYWYNLLRALKSRNTPIYFVSAIFRKDQAFFKWYGKWYRKLLCFADYFFVQNEESKQLLFDLGINNAMVSGDTRFDRVAKIVSTAKPLEIVESFLQGEKAIIAGSSWKAEEAMLLQFSRNSNHQKIIIAPHEVSPENINRLLKQFGSTSILYSEADTTNVTDKSILIIDSYGILTSVYNYGKIAIIGGGFGAGLHNTLEAATFGMPIIFGPNYEKFSEAVDLTKLPAAFPINNLEEFNNKLNYLLTNKEFTNHSSILAREYVRKNIGATRKVLSHIFYS